MPMDDLAIFSLEQLKRWLKLGSDDTKQDEEIATIGNGVSAYVEERTATRWKKRTYTIPRDGDGSSKLLRLPRPIVSVASLAIAGIALEASEYAVYAEAGKIALKSRAFPRGVQNVAVTLDAGYDQIPWNVVTAGLDLAKSHYEEWLNGAISLSSISVGPATAVIKPGLNPRVEKFLDSVRDVRA